MTKKILAILMALALVLSFAACGAKEEPEVTEAPTEATEATETEATEAPTEATEAPTEATEATTETTTETTTEAPKDEKGLNSTDIKEVVEYYNAAVLKTNEGNPKLGGQQSMTLDGDITGDGFLGAVLKVAMPIIEKTLKNSSGTQDNIPGKGKLKPEDVSSASATSKDGVTTINIKLKNQTDGPNADGENGGPVARGIGTLGSIEVALDALGATISEGKENISLTYNDSFINCKVNEDSGKISGGEWHYKVNVLITSAKIKLGVDINAKNLKAVIDWDINI